MQFDLAWLDQDFKRLNRRGKFHPVVRRIGIAARNFLFMLAITDDSAPTAGAGIALAGAIRENLKLLHAGCLNIFSTAAASL